MGTIKIKLLDKSIKVSPKRFVVPNLEFGHGKILSVRKTGKNAEKISTRDLGFKKKDYALNPKIGFYSASETRDFWPQFFIMPRSIHDKMGKDLFRRLKGLVDENYPTIDGWNPALITYEDKISKNQDYVSIGYRILKDLNEYKGEDRDYKRQMPSYDPTDAKIKKKT